MSLTENEKYTSEQDDLIPNDQDKWREIILSTEPIDRQKAKEAIKTAYECINQKQPKIIFCQSPRLALNTIFIEFKGQLGNSLVADISNKIDADSFSNVIQLGRPNIWGEGDLSDWRIFRQLELELNTRFSYRRDGINSLSIHPVRSELWLSNISSFDFDISVDEEDLWPKEKTTALLLFKYCGWVYPFKNVCIVCDRPRKLALDEQQRLHAEGEPALQFADGCKLYAYHGVDLPEKYGKLHLDQWQAEWILSEDNTELRRVLIQGIGYERICQELQAVVVDTWNEYILLKIEIYDELKFYDEVEFEIDYEKGAMSLLTMTCPSTGFIHVLRVPPNIQSAREAICWVNWGIDPEEFSGQT